MIKYLLKKTAYSLLVLFGVVTIVFFLFSVLPGDPAIIILGQHASKDAVEKLHKQIGFDLPLTEQYFYYLNDISPVSLHETKDEFNLSFLDSTKYNYTEIFKLGNNRSIVIKWPYLRKSYFDSNQTVWFQIKSTMPETMTLAVTAILFASIIGITLGVVSALKKDSWLDRGILFFTALNISLPAFVTGIIIMWIFGFLLRDLLHLNHVGTLFPTDDFGEEYISLKNLILPALTLGLRPLALIVQLTRSSMLEVMQMDYIRTAKAKGLSLSKIIFKHALKNALNPVITAISGWFSGLIAGAIFVEKIFDWKGIGLKVFDALEQKDLPVVMGATLFFSIMFVTINFIVDIIYSYLDPRIRLN
ncbi:MAG: ABC transporter permease [Bacteroidota bacterium]|jgi:peptide/nickel transport system permease protein